MVWMRLRERNERRRCLGTDRLDRHHWNVKNVAEHGSRIELGVMLASVADVAQTRSRLRNESERGLPVVRVDCRYLLADQRRTVVTSRRQKTMMVIRLTVSGRARQSCVDKTHEMGGFSPTCFKARSTVK